MVAGDVTGDKPLLVLRLLPVLTTNQKGTIAELQVARAAVELGVGVYSPFGDERCDLIFDLRPRLVRVQCKWAHRHGENILVPLFSARRAADGLRHLKYSAAEIDAFAAYCPDTGRCYFLEFEPQSSVSLRLGPTRNNQARGIRWAHEYELAARLRPLVGAIAQLGERLHGMQEVAGSSPAGSTLF